MGIFQKYPPYDISFKGDTGKNHGVLLYDYAQFSGGQKSYITSQVSGMLGELVGMDDYKTNLTISCTFSVISGEFMPSIRDLKKWLTGTGRLIFSDDPDVFYKVWKVDCGDIARELRYYGQFTVKFTCTPYQFLVSGQRSLAKVTYNSYSLSRPIYTVTGSGNCTLTVNGKTFTGVVNGTLTIDTERQIAYNAEGINQSNLMNGEYEGLYFPSGPVSVSASEGFALSIIPNWGYDV